ncbi:cysteine hydrolase [Pseudoxanthomonas sp. PXM03]|uniref:isochorismatase family cysteine hydrolase n=1 Tax=Pseudoxanthomonas sp. PXM03 TaxID=2769284 RepID=UPI00177ACBE2|nr:isochorismatase family cysteine hydrolase [Pseudoxanthomonas sp. PXM03]MBD9437102.1 cysteine hydrolase [Pseudoxanthomonas sp. PXM03]
MSPMQGYPAGRTALLFVDPYNDFLAEDGKLWPLVADIARSVDLHAHLRTVVSCVRQAGLPVFIVPHHRSEPDDFKGWDHPTPYQLGAARVQPFAKDSWGGEWHPDFAPQPGDIIAKEHWGGSGFSNTDLDYLLKQHRITHVILVGLIANTCIETTGRFASELGYHVTLVRDATAAASAAAMHAAHEINAPTYAHAILTTQGLVDALTARART